MVRDNFKPTLFLNKALNFYPPPSTKSEVISSSPYLRLCGNLILRSADSASIVSSMRL